MSHYYLSSPFDGCLRFLDLSNKTKGYNLLIAANLNNTFVFIMKRAKKSADFLFKANIGKNISSEALQLMNSCMIYVCYTSHTLLEVFAILAINNNVF